MRRSRPAPPHARVTKRPWRGTGVRGRIRPGRNPGRMRRHQGKPACVTGTDWAWCSSTASPPGRRWGPVPLPHTDLGFVDARRKGRSRGGRVIVAVHRALFRRSRGGFGHRATARVRKALLPRNPLERTPARRHVVHLYRRPRRSVGRRDLRQRRNAHDHRRVGGDRGRGIRRFPTVRPLSGRNPSRSSKPRSRPEQISNELRSVTTHGTQTRRNCGTCRVGQRGACR